MRRDFSNWNRPELIRDYDGNYRLVLSLALLPHWNRPELIRDYDRITMRQGTEAQYWNRPELIRDYDQHPWLPSTPCHHQLKQTWIDKGLRHQIFKSALSAFHDVLKQTWIDKGLRLAQNCSIFYEQSYALKQTWIDKGLRPDAKRVAIPDMHQVIETDLNW